MDAEQLAAILEPLEALLTKHLATTGRLLEHCEYLTARNEGLAMQLELLGVRVGTVHAQAIVRDNAITEQMDSLDERLTTVHKAALRAMNLTSREAD